MKWSELAWVVMAALVVVGTVPAVSGATPQDDCCDIMETEALQKYYLKHFKVAGRCTYKMNLKGTDLACDDGYDAKTGGLDFLIDKLRDRSISKMERKCRQELGFPGGAAAEPVIASCTCGGPGEATSLWNQMECILALTQDDVDNAVCQASPVRMNANRGNLSPPGISSFCPEP